MKHKEKNMNDLFWETGKDGGFRVPEDYFDRLPEQVMEKIRRADRTPVSRVVPLPRKRMISLAAAAAILFLVLAGTLLLRRSSQDTAPANGTMTAYVISGDLDEQVLYDFMEQENILPEPPVQSAGDDSIINYLVREGVDESLLAELY